VAMTKKCTACGVEKPLSEFGLRSKKHEWLLSRCKVCARQQSNAWKAANPEYQREYQAANREKINAQKRAYRAANPEKVAEQRRKYVAVNPEYQREYVAANPEKLAAKRRKKRYGITQPQYDALLAEQGGCCAICHEPFVSVSAPHVDHCHTANRVRGLLCGQCNLGIGQFRDNPIIMQSAITYLAQNELGA